MSPEAESKQIDDLKQEIIQLKMVIGKMVEWISKSMLSPLTPKDAKNLIEMLGDDKK